MEPYRKIYIEHNGPIKKNHIIHHCNLDHEDNRIENLISISRGFHFWFHRIVANLSKETLIKLGQGLIDFAKKENK